MQLAKDWRVYSIYLAGQDLTCIKTAFPFVLAGRGRPVVFYLDDIGFV